MKTLLLVFVLFFSMNGFAFTGREAWINSNMQGKVWLLNEYKAFFNQWQKHEELGELNEAQVTLFKLFINSAWAESEMNCIYAGWPSRRVGNVCSSPKKQNGDYKNGTCSQNQLQCQPLLFGKSLCVPVSSQAERSMAFTNCDKKFQQKRISPESLIKEIRADGNEIALFELMNFADKICGGGKQAGSGMCKRLEAAVDRMRHFKTMELTVATADSTKVRKPAVISAGRSISREPPEKVELKEVVEKAETVIKAVNDPVDCEVVQNGEAFDRDEPRPVDFEYATSKRGKDPAWDDTFVKDKNEGLRPTGFELRNVGPNSISGEPIDPREKVERQWRFVSEDNSKRETYLWITDDSGSGYVSGLMESVILLIPRKMKPAIEAQGDDLHVTLTTGEKVIFDKKTKIIKGGIFKEGKVDLNPDKHARKFAPVTYSGTGISIRVDRRGEDPRLITGNAIISQKGKSCQVPARELWNANSDFKFSDDNKLLELLNKKCGNKFSL